MSRHQLITTMVLKEQESFRPKQVIHRPFRLRYDEDGLALTCIQSEYIVGDHNIV